MTRTRRPVRLWELRQPRHGLPCLEIAIRWGETTLEVIHLAPVRDYDLDGETHALPTDELGAQRFVRIRVRGETVTVTFRVTRKLPFLGAFAGDSDGVEIEATATAQAPYVD